MRINVLAIGDVCGQTGLDFLVEKLGGIKEQHGVDFAVVNGENAAGLGIYPAQADAIFDAGADVITLGNHTWGAQKINKYLDGCQHILRPSNFAPQVPGYGWGVFETAFGNVCVINLVGRANMPYGTENPFFEADKILNQADASIVLIDFHAEATSEKLSLAYYLDGRASAIWGTHTHVQTSDAQVFRGGTGYITDLGMTGACDSIIGMRAEQPISRFLGNPPNRFEPADGPAKIEGAVFEIDTETGRCLRAEAIRVL
ncbi:MAG: TIGR00282 family metallophosphoesterase [Oscillospiraceae bacterium]|nr:TIGR00282 family metallophosphoesterase [Oscillospiraceae bacterium]